MKGSDLKAWRQNNGWTQLDLMEELEINSRQTINNWEKAERIPRLAELAIIAIDQVEACRKKGGIRTQIGIKKIASQRHDLWKKHNIFDFDSEVK
jgi:transcriptional regulator with XRE-family HTH domain